MDVRCRDDSICAWAGCGVSGEERPYGLSSSADLDTEEEIFERMGASRICLVYKCSFLLYVRHPKGKQQPFNRKPFNRKPIAAFSSAMGPFAKGSHILAAPLGLCNPSDEK